MASAVVDHLGCALVDPHRPGLAVQPLDLATAHQPEPAHDLDAAIDDPAGRLGRADLGRVQVQRAAGVSVAAAAAR